MGRRSAQLFWGDNDRVHQAGHSLFSQSERNVINGHNFHF